MKLIIPAMRKSTFNWQTILCWIALWICCLPVSPPAGAASPILVVPHTETTLHVAVPWPQGAAFDASEGWRLRETGEHGDELRVDVAPALSAEGRPWSGKWLLLASIPPEAEAKASRRFRLEAAGSDATAGARSVFRFADVSDKSLGLWEGARPVLVYNHGTMSRADAPAKFNRSTYVHPLYGLDGEVLTDDFPTDHYHHRGLFWAWPHVRIGDSHYDLWGVNGVHQRFERWLARDTGQAAASLGVENGWYVGERKVVQERVWLRAYAATPDERVLDLDFTWIPVEQPATLAGAEGKSYGGLTLRFAPRTDTVITTPLGNKPDDLAMTRLACADLSARIAGAARPSGAAIFIAPDHPDYPPMWLTRHYGVLCVGWPGVEPRTFKPGEPIRCRYRVWIHRDVPEQAKLERVYESYRLLERITWEAPAR